MSENLHNLLEDPLLSVRLSDGSTSRLSLAQVFAHLSGEGIESFEALQPHQQQGWYCFLVQLAALARTRGKMGVLSQQAADWRAVLLALSNGEEAAWAMVARDVQKPAFLQPPVPEGSLEKAKFKTDTPYPDDLDVLITAKNHDVKMRRITSPEVEHWIYALITLQTMEGFLGAGNYGIARMNGGFGNRPLVGLSPGLGWGERFRRDVELLAESREALASERYDLEGAALLWLLPWDGSKASALPLRTLDPFFIEICRRIRFTVENDELLCCRTSSKGYRIDTPKQLNGNTGDPWTPIDLVNSKALTLGGKGFDYKTLQQILFSSEEFEQPLALKFTAAEDDQAYLVASALVRGQGITEGLHQRTLAMPKKVAGLFRRKGTAHQEMARRSKERVISAALVRNDVLKPGVRLLLTAGDGGKLDFSVYGPWLEAFDRAIDARFFDELWAAVDLSDQEALLQWQRVLFDEARRQFEHAVDSASLPDIRRLRAISRAEGAFYGLARKHLTALFPAVELVQGEQQ